MDPYAILGISRNASSDDIKQAYRKLASKHHPDRGGDTKKFQEIQAAYQALTEPQAQPFNNPGGWPGFNPSGNFPGNPFQDIINQFHRQARQKIYTVTVYISLEQVSRGEYEDIQIHTGEGPKLIKIQIPQGIEDGETVRYQDLMPDGILQITFRVQSHQTFERRGLDLYLNFNINFLQLIVGSTITVNTISGKSFELTIPPRTQNGTKFRLAGQGLSRSGHSGDQYVLINARIPDKISENLLSAIKQEIQ